MMNKNEKKRLFGPLVRKVVEKDSKALNRFKNGRYLNQKATKVNDELNKEISPLASLSFDVKKIPEIRIIPATPKKKSKPNKSVRIVEKLTRKELDEKLKFLSENLCASKIKQSNFSHFETNCHFSKLFRPTVQKTLRTFPVGEKVSAQGSKKS